MGVIKAGSGKGKKGHAETALEYIRKIYAIEKLLPQNLTPEKIKNDTSWCA